MHQDKASLIIAQELYRIFHEWHIVTHHEKMLSA